MILYYFAQRGRWVGYWRRVPCQTGRDLIALRSALTARGHLITVAEG